MGQAKKTRKRHSIEGPTDVAHDLSRQAYAFVGQLPDGHFGEEIHALMGHGHGGLRLRAFGTLESCAAQGLLSQDDTARVATGMMDRSQIRCTIFCPAGRRLRRLLGQLSAPV